jgi:hypothetical protein
VSAFSLISRCEGKSWQEHLSLHEGFALIGCLGN